MRSIVFSIQFLFFLFVCLVVGQTSAASTMFGVTIDDPWTQQEEIRDALSSHTVRPTTRIVFDEHVAASEYREPVENIAAASDVMGEILDSAYVADYTVQQYLDRTTEYLDEFEGLVDIWEIGNEVNGDWLGSAEDVKAKIEGAYGLIHDRGQTTALNLYYNLPGVGADSEYEMFNWIEAYVTDEMKNGLDYVFFSYYEDDNNGVIYSQDEWQAVFDSLRALFPNSKLGFGEIGTENADSKAEIMNRYYSLDIQGEYFVGGYFWWYYKQDCVPKTTELWTTLDTIVTESYNGANNPIPEPATLVLLGTGLVGLAGICIRKKS